MIKYRRLTRTDRCHIERCLSQGKSIRRIADELGFHRSSIYRELERGEIKKGIPGGKKKGEYSAREANRRAISTFHDSRRTCFYRGYKIKGWVEDQIRLRLNLYWSPQQISNRLKEDQNFNLSTEAIYKYILSMKNRGYEYHKYLRHAGRRRKRTTRRSRYWELQCRRRRSIDDRPLEAAQRAETGHWERDLMLGRRNTGAVLTIVDRRTRYTLLTKLKTTEAGEANERTHERIKKSGLKCLTMTNDNGHEFGEFWKLEPKLKSKVYFTHPLCPWERGTVENTIGLIRQFIPKGSDLTNLSDEDLALIETMINCRPRKSLNYKTPMEELSGVRKKLIRKEKLEKYQGCDIRDVVEKEFLTHRRCKVALAG